MCMNVKENIDFILRNILENCDRQYNIEKHVVREP